MYNDRVKIYNEGKIMTKQIILTTTLLAMMGLSGCTSTPKPTPKYNINKAKNIEHIKRTFELYTTHKSPKAMAVAMDKEGKYVIGYSYDCASTQSANMIALNRCRQANSNAPVKAEASCAIYAIENQIINPLK